MFRKQIITHIRRYNHQHCEKNISQLNCNKFFENNEKRLNLIFEQQTETNKLMAKVQNNLNIIFIYSIINIVVVCFVSF